MENRKLEIIAELENNKEGLSSLFSLYNSLLLEAEDYRVALSEYFEQLIDKKNELSLISNMIYNSKKDERTEVYTKNKTKIKKFGGEIDNINKDFDNSLNNFKSALKKCGSLKTEYKTNISNLCKEYKALNLENAEENINKLFNKKVKVIKLILQKIENLISDYNVKKNKTEEDKTRFTELYSSAKILEKQLQTIA